MLIYYYWPVRIIHLFFWSRLGTFYTWNSENCVYVPIFCRVYMFLKWITKLFIDEPTWGRYLHGLSSVVRMLLELVLQILFIFVNA